MPLIKLTKNEFRVVPEGEQTLTITEAKAVPSGRPQYIEVNFQTANGESLRGQYQLDNSKSMFVFSLLVESTLGACDEIDTSDLKLLVGKFVRVYVTHTEKPSTKREGETVVFANISKILGEGEPFATPTKVATPAAASVPLD